MLSEGFILLFILQRILDSGWSSFIAKAKRSHIGLLPTPKLGWLCCSFWAPQHLPFSNELASTQFLWFFDHNNLLQTFVTSKSKSFEQQLPVFTKDATMFPPILYTQPFNFFSAFRKPTREKFTVYDKLFL